MRVQLGKKSSFVPEWNDNRELDEGEQIVAHWENLSWDQRKPFYKKQPTKVLMDITRDDEEVDAEIERQTAEVCFEINTAGMANEMNITLDNLEDENGNPIDTWEKLKAAPDNPELNLAGLIQEIEDKATGSQKRVQGKNSK